MCNYGQVLLPRKDVVLILAWKKAMIYTINFSFNYWTNAVKSLRTYCS